MRIFLRLCLAAGLVALGIGLWTLIFPSPEVVIRKRLVRVAELASFGASEGELARLGNVGELTRHFSTNVQILVDVPGYSRQVVNNRNDLFKAAMGVRQILSGLKVQFIDLNILLDSSKTEATVQLTGHARAGSEQDVFVQELKLILRKVDGEWLIISVETVRTLT